jgi:hypothetical protein
MLSGKFHGVIRPTTPIPASATSASGAALAGLVTPNVRPSAAATRSLGDQEAFHSSLLACAL